MHISRSFTICLVVAAGLLAACEEQGFDSVSETEVGVEDKRVTLSFRSPEHEEEAVGSRLVEAGAEGAAPQAEARAVSGSSLPRPPAPDYDVSGSYSPSSGEGSVSISGPAGKKASSKSSTDRKRWLKGSASADAPSQLRWGTTSLQYTLDGNTQTYRYTSEQQQLMTALRNQINQERAVPSPLPPDDCPGPQLARQEADPVCPESIGQLEQKGYQVTKMAGGKLQVTRTISPDMEAGQAGEQVSGFEVRYTLDAQTRRIKRAEMYQNGVMVYEHVPGADPEGGYLRNKSGWLTLDPPTLQ